MLKEAASQNTWASPIHPSLSSRCGQSVGKPQKLDFWLQSEFSQNFCTTALPV